MVLQEFSIHDNVSPSHISPSMNVPFGVVSSDFNSPHQKSINLQQKKKLKRKTCNICGKRLKGPKALSQHTRAKHPNSLRKNLKANRKLEVSHAPTKSTSNAVKCLTCGVQISTKDGLYAHFTAKHQSSSVVLDENLSSNVSQVQQLAGLFNVVILPFPVQLQGKADNTVLDNLLKIKTGLITRDKYFAKKAAMFIAPVFLLWQN
ncbi:MAG: hypothetical protein E4G98_03250, partial [Promethearchaeota archaeon]